LALQLVLSKYPFHTLIHSFGAKSVKKIIAADFTVNTSKFIVPIQ
jgi:hypothetical protein